MIWNSALRPSLKLSLWREGWSFLLGMGGVPDITVTDMEKHPNVSGSLNLQRLGPFSLCKEFLKNNFFSLKYEPLLD